MKPVIWIVAILQIFSVSIAMAGDKHLFILSGQSNMVGMKPEVSFTPTVTKPLAKKTSSSLRTPMVDSRSAPGWIPMI